MLHDVKSLLGRLLRGRATARRPMPPPPDFDEAALFGNLKGPPDAVTAWREGRRDTAWETLVDHFSRRRPPLGFIAPDRISALLGDAERRFPAWRERLLAKVRTERDEGLAVYDRKAGPLTGSFDWGVTQDGPLADRLYGARPHRFGFLPRWALACHYDAAMIPALEDVMAGWMSAAKNPGGHPGFKSSHVVVYHFLALLLAWPFIAALPAPSESAGLASLRRRVLLSLYEGSRFMAAASGSSVANNHLLAERFADWLIAALLPEFDHALARDEAEVTWLAELDRQLHDDGGSFEHSVHYQEHACEMALAYLLLSRRNDWAVPAPARAKIEAMLAFQLALAGPDLIPFAAGNTTEDPLLVLGVGEEWQLGLLREIQRACFTADAPAAPDGDPPREAAFWLLEGAVADGGGPPVAEPAFQPFPDSGFYVLAEPETRARLVLRLGPSPDFPGIGGHSHGDLLSLALTVGGTAVLAQPGTATYRFKPHPELPGKPNLRAHFASAAARSALFLEGAEPYGALTGDFRNWRLPCQVAPRQDASASAGLSWVEGRVVGESAYLGNRRGVIHVWNDCWLVYDRLPARRKSLPAFVGWQFAPGVACDLRADARMGTEARAADAHLRLQAVGTEAPDVVSGAFEPLRGWVSPSYGRLEAAPNLRFPLGPDSREAAFLLDVLPAEERSLEQLLAEEEALGFRITAPGEEMLLLLDSAESPSGLRVDDISFRGRLLCLHRGAQGLRVRALGLTHLSAPTWGLALSAAAPADFEVVMVDGSTQWPRGDCPAVDLGPQCYGD